MASQISAPFPRVIERFFQEIPEMEILRHKLRREADISYMLFYSHSLVCIASTLSRLTKEKDANIAKQAKHLLSKLLNFINGYIDSLDAEENQAAYFFAETLDLTGSEYQTIRSCAPTPLKEQIEIYANAENLVDKCNDGKYYYRQLKELCTEQSP